jgi:hypothetical protein
VLLLLLPLPCTQHSTEVSYDEVAHADIAIGVLLLLLTTAEILLKVQRHIQVASNTQPCMAT